MDGVVPIYPFKSTLTVCTSNASDGVQLCSLFPPPSSGLRWREARQAMINTILGFAGPRPEEASAARKHKIIHGETVFPPLVPLVAADGNSAGTPSTIQAIGGALLPPFPIDVSTAATRAAALFARDVVLANGNAEGIALDASYHELRPLGTLLAMLPARSLLRLACTSSYAMVCLGRRGVCEAAAAAGSTANGGCVLPLAEYRNPQPGASHWRRMRGAFDHAAAVRWQCDTDRWLLWRWSSCSRGNAGGTSFRPSAPAQRRLCVWLCACSHCVCLSLRLSVFGVRNVRCVCCVCYSNRSAVVSVPSTHPYPTRNEHPLSTR